MARYEYQGHEEVDEPSAPGNSSADALVAYRPPSDEGTPLLPGKTPPKISKAKFQRITTGLLGLTCILFVSVTLVVHFAYCPWWPSTMSAVRRGWEREVADQDLLRETWRLEDHDHTVIIEKWKLEAEWHEREVEHRVREENERRERARKEWAREQERHLRDEKEYEEGVARRVREEQNRQQRVQEEWEQEKMEHDKNVERRMREEEEREEEVRKEWEEEVARKVHEEEERQAKVREQWDQELREHEQEVARRILAERERQEIVRRDWAQEEQQHQHECEEMERREKERQEKERMKWRREVEDHDQIEEDRRRREEEERQKLNMFWSQVEARTCITYGTREYTAQLSNLPATWEHRVEACKATPLEVHGLSYLPKTCEDKGPGAVIGRWEIDQHEPDCATFWSWYKDKGCTSPGSGKRRIEHYMDNLPKGGDWREFCATTPAHFLGMEFSGAHECFQYNMGTYGQWEIDDISCQ